MPDDGIKLSVDIFVEKRAYKMFKKLDDEGHGWEAIGYRAPLWRNCQFASRAVPLVQANGRPMRACQPLAGAGPGRT